MIAALALAVPLLTPGVPVGAVRDAAPVAPVAYHVEGRVPPLHDGPWYLAGGPYVGPFTVTIVHRDGSRMTLAARRDLPGATIEVELPPDAADAARIEIDGKASDARSLPRLVTLRQIVDARLVPRRIYFAFAGAFIAMGIVALLCGLLLRDRVLGWYAGVTFAMAAIDTMTVGDVPWPTSASFAIVHATLLSGYFLAVVAFSAAFFGRFGDRRWRWGLWLLAALCVTVNSAADVLGDRWTLDGLDELAEYGLIAGLLAYGVAAARAGRAAAKIYVIAFACAALGIVLNDLANRDIVPALFLPSFDLGVTTEAILLATALAVRFRTAERTAIQMRQLAAVDGLTGLANRRTIDERLTLEWERARRSGAPLGALMIDVDHFKRFNDANGHLAGDDALRAVGEAIASIVARRDDVVGRFGGEEFLALLPSTDIAGGIAIAERVRSAVHRATERLPFRHAPLTVSIGVASIAAVAPATAEQLVARADAALYVAKAAGRDRVVSDTLPESNEVIHP